MKEIEVCYLGSFERYYSKIEYTAQVINWIQMKTTNTFFYNIHMTEILEQKKWNSTISGKIYIWKFFKETKEYKIWCFPNYYNSYSCNKYKLVFSLSSLKIFFLTVITFC